MQQIPGLSDSLIQSHIKSRSLKNNHPKPFFMSYFASTSRYENMKYNRCGRSGLLLPAVSLGLWHNFGGKDDYNKMKDILLKAFDLGITHIDIANNYGPPPGSAATSRGHCNTWASFCDGAFHPTRGQTKNTTRKKLNSTTAPRKKTRKKKMSLSV